MYPLTPTDFLLLGICLIALVVALVLAYRNEPIPFTIGKLELTAQGDRILIQEDPFRSGYECAECEGRGTKPCHACNETGQSLLNSQIQCKACHGSKVITCPACAGKGGLLVAPDISQRRPTTGKIVSGGRRVKHLHVGESVLYSNFAGYVIDTNDVTIRILHEPEVLSRIKGHLTMRRGANELPDSFDSSNSFALDKAIR